MRGDVKRLNADGSVTAIENPLTGGRQAAELGMGGRRVKYIHGNWEHIFADGVSSVIVRFALNATSKNIVAMEVQDHDAWRDATNIEMADVQDSLINANEVDVGTVDTWGLSLSGALPEWVMGSEKRVRLLPRRGHTKPIGGPHFSKIKAPKQNSDHFQ